MSNLRVIAKRIASLEEQVSKLVDLLNREETTETWITAEMVKDITGWSQRELRNARWNGVVKFQGRSKGGKYLLESLPEEFKIRKTEIVHPETGNS